MAADAASRSSARSPGEFLAHRASRLPLGDSELALRVCVTGSVGRDLRCNAKALGDQSVAPRVTLLDTEAPGIRFTVVQGDGASFSGS